MGKVSSRKNSTSEYHRSSSKPYKVEFYVWFVFCKQISVGLLDTQMICSFDQKVLSLFHMIKLNPETNELNPLPQLMFLPISPHFPVVRVAPNNAFKSEDLNNVL